MIVSWMTTNQCNLKCSHCYQDAGEKYSQELTTAEAKKMIDSIAEAGFQIMIFSGGEPLMRPDIFELVVYASSKGLRPVFGTNGMLITKETAEKLKGAGAQAMGISLDSLDPEKHNKFRGDNQAYQLAVAGMKNCREAGLPFQIHITLMDWNRDEVCDMIDFAAEIGAVGVQVFFLIPVGRGKYIEETSLEVMEYERTLQKIMAKSAKVPISVKPTCAPQFTRVAEQMDIPTRFSRGCLAGITYCIVSPVGDIRPCAYMTEAAGNVHTDDFAEVWQNSSLFKTLRTESYGGTCKDCEFKNKCGGCRARGSYYHDGDYMAEDSYCAYGKQLLEKMQEISAE